MIPYLMRTPSDCGPAAISAATEIPYEQVLAAWPGGWGEDDRGRLGMPNDTPANHAVVLEALGIKARIVTCGEILSGTLPADRVIALLHDLKSPILVQHWVVVQGADAQGVRCHMGNGKIKQYSFNDFTELYSAGWPACAYVIGEPPRPLRWWERILNWLARRV